MQHLEGPAEPLLRVYSSIRADPRHRLVIELLNEPVRGREFQGWSMGFMHASQQTLKDLSTAGPPAGNPSLLARGRGLLRRFWEQQRRRT